MAQQTKSKSSGSSGGRSNTRKSANGRTAAKSRSRASRAQKARTPKPKAKASSSNQKGAVDAAKDATAKGANAAGNAVTSTAKKLKIPLIATGTGLAGVAAGVALTQKSKGISGIHLPSRGTRRATTKGLGEAAKNIGMLAERTGKVAQQVRVASEAIGEGSAPRKSKSAIEVVLEGLTSRQQSRAG